MNKLQKKFYLLNYKSLTAIANELGVTSAAITKFINTSWPNDRAEQLEKISGGKIKAKVLLEKKPNKKTQSAIAEIEQMSDKDKTKFNNIDELFNSLD